MTRLSRAQAAGVTLVLFTAISAGAWAAGPAFSSAALFVLPVALAAWSLGMGAGLIVGFAASAVSAAINGTGPAFAPHVSAASAVGAAWNLGMRAFATVTIVLLVAGFRRTFDLERWRARHDGLTGALNKHAFLANLHAVNRTARLGGKTLLLAYLDLDRFKAVNDAHGHAAGDAVLRSFAAGAMGLLRNGDCFARFGGDEFVILAHAQDSDDALRAGERIHARLTALLHALPYDVQISMGAVIVPPQQLPEADALIGLADSLMYEVKRSGRNALRMAMAGQLSLVGQTSEMRAAA